MRVISRRTLRVFWQRPGRGDAEQPLKAWYNEASDADWASPADVRAAFRSASLVGNDRIVFNIAGNKYRLVVRVNYQFRLCYVRFVGTHAEYDRIDVSKV